MRPDAEPARGVPGADAITPFETALVKAGRTSMPVLETAALRRLLDRLRHKLRVRQYAIRTEAAYVHWARRYILFRGKRCPAAIGAGEVAAFLAHLAGDRTVVAGSERLAVNRALASQRSGIARPD